MRSSMKEAALASIAYCWSPITDFMPRSATARVDRVTSSVATNTRTAATQAMRSFRFAGSRRRPRLSIENSVDLNATKYYILIRSV